MSSKDKFGEDAQATIMSLLKNNVKVTKDNNRKATLRVTQGWFNGEIFTQVDAHIVVNQIAPSPAHTMNIGGTWKKYIDSFVIVGFAIDKKGITAKIMRHKLRRQIEETIKTNRKAPGGDLTRISVTSTMQGRNPASKPPNYSCMVTVSTIRYKMD